MSSSNYAKVFNMLQVTEGRVTGGGPVGPGLWTPGVAVCVCSAFVFVIVGLIRICRITT